MRCAKSSGPRRPCSEAIVEDEAGAASESRTMANATTLPKSAGYDLRSSQITNKDKLASEIQTVSISAHPSDQ